MRQAWSTAVEHLYRTADGTRATAQSTLDAVMAAPSHPPKGSDLYQALVAAAHHALVTAPVVTAHDIPAWRTGYHQIPELGALGFLLTATQDATVPQTDAARWAGWALALAALLDPGEDSALRYTLLQHCADQAGPAFVTAVEDRLHHMPHRLDELTETLASASLHDATDAMYHWASTPGCPLNHRATYWESLPGAAISRPERTWQMSSRPDPRQGPNAGDDGSQQYWSSCPATA